VFGGTLSLTQSIIILVMSDCVYLCSRCGQCQAARSASAACRRQVTQSHRWCLKSSATACAFALNSHRSQALPPVSMPRPASAVCEIASIARVELRIVLLNFHVTAANLRLLVILIFYVTSSGVVLGTVWTSGPPHP